MVKTRTETRQILSKQPKRLSRQERAQTLSETGKRELNRREKLARISEAARTLIRRKGFDAVTTQEVAARAGMAAGTLFLYVGTKEDLLLVAFLGEILDVMEHISQSTPPRACLEEQALHFLEGMFAYHAEDIDLTRHLMRELAFVRNPQRRDEVSQVIGAAFDKLQAMVEQAKVHGHVHAHVDARSAAMDLFSLFFAPMASWSNGFITRETYVRSLRRSVHLMVSGLKSACNEAFMGHQKGAP